MILLNTRAAALTRSARCRCKQKKSPRPGQGLVLQDEPDHVQAPQWPKLDAVRSLPGRWLGNLLIYLVEREDRSELAAGRSWWKNG
jgi:hypothetical protein